ncbi:MULTISPECIES: HD domain-containing protein [unclassified Lentimicrobium]|uniref:HD domain-containing protein n=1 Tax=unclassified Lentimicrobium TaxID=2677434 RepID=UPI001552F73B|nr:MULTISPECIES: HD domain-containing protein [unclassified Lentimicrobium]NPD46595.1 HD domain-containing protein [Lentimicrobium sp. S6]NPD83814.1 HD domain-containing protein [Lentimicrobium sp. L6]
MIDFSRAKQYILNELGSDLSKDFLYHDLAHTLDVVQAAVNYGKMHGLAEHELTLLKTAALYHDVGLIDVFDGHEDRSIEIVRKVLPGFGYSSEDVEMVANMIQATKLPQSPKTVLEEFLCDADLDYLGRDDFFILASKLQLEWRRLGVKDIAFDEWIGFEKGFLKSHQYFSREARELRDAGKLDNLEQLKNICKKNLE